MTLSSTEHVLKSIKKINKKLNEKNNFPRSFITSSSSSLPKHEPTMASIASILKPSDIITKDGSPVDFTGKRIGLYFSAHVRIRLFVSSSP
tara:strand:+ start:872 stop:1144 length:273 start_codon:yes stop_codon:yes gene_type:complete